MSVILASGFSAFTCKGVGCWWRSGCYWWSRWRRQGRRRACCCGRHLLALGVAVEDERSRRPLRTIVLLRLRPTLALLALRLPPNTHAIIAETGCTCRRGRMKASPREELSPSRPSRASSPHARASDQPSPAASACPSRPGSSGMRSDGRRSRPARIRRRLAGRTSRAVLRGAGAARYGVSRGGVAGVRVAPSCPRAAGRTPRGTS